MRVLAIDPGARTAGLVVRDHGDELIEAIACQREPGEPLERWANTVANHATAIAHAHAPDLVAIEGIAAPTPHMGTIAVGALLDTAYVAGALATLAGLLNHAVILVPPAGFGAPIDMPGPMARRVLLARYPEQLVGPTETTGAGKGPKQHLRAAWDLAHAALFRARVEEAAR